jgi:hypothetical protein
VSATNNRRRIAAAILRISKCAFQPGCIENGGTGRILGIIDYYAAASAADVRDCDLKREADIAEKAAAECEQRVADAKAGAIPLEARS